MLTNIVTFSYSIAALAFLSLLLLLLTRWRARPNGMAMSAASACALAWSMALAWHAQDVRATAWLADMLELLRNGAWTLVLLALLGHFRAGGMREFWRNPLLLVLVGLYVAVVIDRAASFFAPELLGPWIYMVEAIARMGMALMGMLLVEQLYRNTPLHERWGVKFVCLGIGGMFVYDFYLYSDALLMRRINPEIWAARGVVNALTAPLIAVAVARSAAWSTQLSVSRRVLFHSAALFGSAAYLLAMGAAGYYVRYFGG